MLKKEWKIGQIFVAFSEYLNFAISILSQNKCFKRFFTQDLRITKSIASISNYMNHSFSKKYSFLKIKLVSTYQAKRLPKMSDHILNKFSSDFFDFLVWMPGMQYNKMLKNPVFKVYKRANTIRKLERMFIGNNFCENFDKRPCERDIDCQ